MNKAITVALFALILASLLGRSVWLVVTHEIGIVAATIAAPDLPMTKSPALPTAQGAP